MHAFKRVINTTSRRVEPTTMGSIEDTIAFLRSSDGRNTAAAAKRFNVNRSTLSKRFRGKTGSVARRNEGRRLLTNKQEQELVKQIQRLREWCLPPTPAMVRSWAALICGSEPGKNWSADFRRRHESVLDCRYLNTLDLERHKAESEHSFRRYFNILRQKIDEYGIQPRNCYNMDEKGFLIGHLQKARRIFPKSMTKQQKLLGAGQDGSREWITLVATICADGTSLPPALIYKAVSGDLQDTWLQDYDSDEHPCWFASSPNGWTSDELGLSWLQSLFDTQTVGKAKRDWRLLILDGHGSHCTLRFLDWCRSNKILVAIFPPHSTHRLQPLDVSVFGPLATYYSQQLDHHTRLSQGLVALSKRDFFKNFYPAYDKAFTEENIKAGWRKTGLEPFNPQRVLNIFERGEADDKDIFPDQAQSEGHSSCCLDSPSAMRTIRRVVSEGVALGNAQSQRLVDKLGNACLTFATELILAREREQGFIEAIGSQQNKSKRGRPFTEDLRAKEGLGALFFSPSKINRAKALQAAKDEEKETEAQNKLMRARYRATRKAQKEAEVQQRRQDRAARAAARKAEEALQKAKRQQQREAKEVQRRLETESKASGSRHRKRRRVQKKPEEHMTVAIESEPQDVPKRLMSRSGRIIKKRAYLDDE